MGKGWRGDPLRHGLARKGVKTGRRKHIGSHKTRVDKNDNVIRVRYWNTDVVTVGPEFIVLDNGGYWTNTTKRRMNQASEEYGLGYHVFQKKGDWFVEYGNKTLPFSNGMKIKRVI